VKAPHLLRVEEGPERYAELVAALRGAGLRVGWLELGAAAPEAEPAAPPELETAAGLGCLRAVAAGGGRTVAVKPLAGPPVLRDLLREHFLGCRLVLVRGAAEAPRLTPGPGGWTVTTGDDAAFSGTSDALAAELRKPRPWD
jgi:hypothetical protein